MKRLRDVVTLLLVLASTAAVAQHDESLHIESLINRSTSSAIRSQLSPDFLVARTSSEWAAAWRLPFIDQDGQENGLPPLPIVDFQRSIVVGIILPTHSHGCTGVTIDRAIASKGTLVVKYRVRKPQPTDICTASFATAYHFVSVERSLLPVVFSESE